MKKFISCILALFFLSSYSPAEADKEFLAVYSMPGTDYAWEEIKPDIYYIASSWNSFEDFLKRVKKESHGKRIVLDIDCHGNPQNGYLENSYMNFNHEFIGYSNLGYICNQIDKNLPINRVTLLLESCFSEHVYHGLHDHTYVHMDGNQIEPYRLNSPPPYPVYGIGPFANLDNFIYLQRKFHIYVSYHDLREYENKAEDPMDLAMTSTTAELIKETDVILRTFGK